MIFSIYILQQTVHRNTIIDEQLTPTVKYEKTGKHINSHTSVPPACLAFLSRVSSSEYWRSDCRAESMFFAAFSNDSVDMGLLADELVVMSRR